MDKEHFFFHRWFFSFAFPSQTVSGNMTPELDGLIGLNDIYSAI